MVRYSSTYDVIQAGGTTHSYSGGGTGANQIDGSFSTATTVQLFGSSTATVTLEGTHNFNQDVYLLSVKFQLRGLSATDTKEGPHSGYVRLDVDVYRLGAWESVYNNDTETTTIDKDSGVQDLTVNLSGCSQIRITAAANAESSSGSPNTHAECWIYEIQATAIINRSFGAII